MVYNFKTQMKSYIIEARSTKLLERVVCRLDALDPFLPCWFPSLKEPSQPLLDDVD